MFSKMATYLTGELTATSEDYKLLENMNKLTSLKYLEMKDIAINISRNLKDLNQKYAALQPYLEQINLIEEQVAALEQAAYKLDAYSKRLESQMHPDILITYEEAKKILIVNVAIPFKHQAFNDSWDHKQKYTPLTNILRGCSYDEMVNRPGRSS
ncbi:PREDICTED: biogenesis of lysosome-related organelles complex 1 subunit 2 [Gavialis gangeticus]|uniref:biogenesis of lysosome-related organelles complex 1 subunit 2 n=1 Tax=Gavialis gangeticus TaxID=94835 RepID=UPI00092FBB40|nr:PREDICTED: biogenesis of lysosome-related organelles complex 1 subunit 2 [Gavialis gangeticus]